MKSEIKIGNFLKYRNGEIITVKGIKPHCGDYMITIDDGWRYLKNCSSIPLTEDCLKKLGFEYTIETTWSSGHEEKYKVWKNGKLTFNEVQGAWWFHGMLFDHQLKYVHQLQNFHHAITGSDLTLKE